MVSEVIKSTHSRLCEELSLSRFQFESQNPKRGYINLTKPDIKWENQVYQIYQPLVDRGNDMLGRDERPNWRTPIFMAI